MKRAIGLSLPLLLLIGSCLLVSCKQDDRRSGPVPADAPALTPLGHIPDFSLVNQTGESFGSKELTGKPYIAAFMFTRCPSVCPRVTARMLEVAQAATKQGLPLRLLSISVDGDYDTPKVLSAYAKKHSADRPEWFFLTGDHKLVAETAEKSFKVGVSGNIDEGKPHLGITHGSHLILVDAQGDIRNYYRSFDDDTVERVTADLARL